MTSFDTGVQSHPYAAYLGRQRGVSLTQTVGGVASAAANVAAAITTGGLSIPFAGGIDDLLPNLFGGGSGGKFSEAQLLQVQIRESRRAQAFTMQSNIEKTRHDSRMSAVRNMRA